MKTIGRRWRNPERAGSARQAMPALMRAFALLATIAVSACGGGNSDIEVQRMAALPPDARQATFIVLKAKAQRGGKDYASLADQIAGQLTAKGFSRVDAAANARYGLMFSYDGDGAGWIDEQGRRSSVSRKGEGGKYERNVSIVLYDLTRPNRADEEVFGARAQCTVETAKHDLVVWSAMVDAALRDFPGEANEKYSVSLPKLE